jgi:hypothetical protein
MKKVITLFILTLCLVKAKAHNNLDIAFQTGNDNFAVRDASIQSKLNIKINYKNAVAPIVLKNVNKNQNWPKHSNRKIIVPLPNDVDVNNVASIEIYRRANSNIIDDLSADNLDLQGLTIFASIKKRYYRKRLIILTIG